MSEITGKEVIEKLGGFATNDMWVWNRIYIDEAKALLSYIDALEEVARAARGSVGVVFCWEYNEKFQQKEECSNCGARLICQALNRLREMECT